METSVDQGTMTKAEVLSQADQYLSTVEQWQRLALRAGMVLIPIAAILVAYVMVMKKYKLDEKEYNRIVSELSQRQE